MTIVLLLVHLLARGVQMRAVGYDDVVAAVGRGVPDRLVLSHEEGRDAGGEAAEGRWGDLGCDGGGGGGCWAGTEGGEGDVGGAGGDVVPGAGVG